jgi:FtsZ-binding cell division protein ZapB
MKFKTKTQQTLKTMRHDILQLKQEKAGLLRDISSMQKRRSALTKALQADEATLQQRLTSTLTKMKDEKPELFNITLENR